MIKRELYYRELLESGNVSLHCFDVLRYRHDSDRINYSVWANFRGETYFSKDIFIHPPCFCDWNGSEWVLKRHQEVILQKGIQDILDELEINYQDKSDGTDKHTIG